MRPSASLIAFLAPLWLVVGCTDASNVSGSVAGRDLTRIEPPVYASVTLDGVTSLYVFLTTVEDPCAAETAWIEGQAQALETLQAEWEAAADQPAREAASTHFSETLDDLERDYAGTGEEVRTLLIWEDDEESAPLADAQLVQRAVGERVSLEVCLFEGGELEGDACYPGVSGQLYLEPFGNRFRGEGSAEVADPDDPDDPEGSVELFFDARACVSYEEAAVEWADEYARAASIVLGL
jgi:hypothetical protein